jgi:hypothetical protein
MTQVEILDAARERAGGYKVDVSRGERIGRVSSEWFSRPADERYLSLSDLYAAVHGRTERTVDVTVAISPNLFINTGGPHTPFAFNTTLSGLSISFITPPGGTFAKGTLSYDEAGGSNTPYGSFSRAIDSSAGNGTVNGYGGILDFTVSLASGISTTDFVSNAGGGGYYFSADVGNGTNTSAIASNGPTTTPVPKPASLMLLGTAMIGLTPSYDGIVPPNPGQEETPVTG